MSGAAMALWVGVDKKSRGELGRAEEGCRGQ